MKKIGLILLAFILLIAGCSQVQDNQQDIKAILGKEKLVVGTSADYPPYEFIQQVDGKQEFVGFDMDLARYIADSWGVDLEIQDVKFDALLTGLETGMYDLVIAGMTPDPNRKANFSHIYYKSNHGVVIKKTDAETITSLESLPGKKVGVQMGSIQEGIADGIEGINKTSLSNINNLILELKSGKVDALIMETPVAQSYVNANQDLMMVENLVIDDGQGGTAIAIKEGRDDLTNQVNLVLEQVEKDKLMEEWVVAANQLASGVQADNTSQTSPYNLLIKGLVNTLALSALSLIFGLALSLVLVFARRSKGIFSLPAKIYVELFRGTPLMLQILIVYFGLDVIGISLNAFTASLIAVALNSAAYVSEIVRSGIESIPKGQMEAGRSLGLSQKQTMKEIILPQAVRNILPALGNEFITLIKETSIASTIGVGELMYQTSKIQSLTYQALKPLLLVSLIYFVLTFGLSLVMKRIEKRMTYDN